MKFDPTKEVQTRDGRKARIICTDMKSVYPVIAVVCDEGRDEEDLQTYTENGSFTGDDNTHRADLINVSQTWWVNIYADEEVAAGGLYESRNAAEGGRDLGSTCIACIEFTEGQGLGDTE